MEEGACLVIAHGMILIFEVVKFGWVLFIHLLTSF